MKGPAYNAFVLVWVAILVGSIFTKNVLAVLACGFAGITFGLICIAAALFGLVSAHYHGR